MIDHFPQLGDDLDALMNAPLRGAIPPQADIAPAQGFDEPCAKCRGTGKFTSWSGRIVGACFTCKGAGKRTFKNTPEVRAAKREVRAVRAKVNGEIAWDAFAAKYAAEAASIKAEAARGVGFAASMIEAVTKYGALTERQLAAVRRGAQRADDKPKATGVLIKIDAITAALATAAGQGVAKPRLRVADMVFKIAGPGSRNPGATYIKRGGEYIGKNLAGVFHRARTCTDDDVAEITRIAADPAGAAMQHGRLLGSCSCCGRTLSDPDSIAHGIGPICAARFGF